MITRVSYLAALETIDLYHRQREVEAVEAAKAKTSLLKLVEDIRECKIGVSTRLFNALCAMSRDHDLQQPLYMEDVDMKTFLKYRNVGKSSWAEFCELRQQYLSK